MELSSAIFHNIKNKTPILAAPSMQLSFQKYNNLFTLYLGQKLFNVPKIKDFMKNRTNLVYLLNAGFYLKTEASMPINDNFKNYFAQNFKEKKYINFSTNFLWYFFSTYAFLLKSERFKKIINSKKYLSLFNQKITKFVPYFNLIYPFANLIENKYFERAREQERKKEKERGLLEDADRREYMEESERNEFRKKVTMNEKIMEIFLA